MILFRLFSYDDKHDELPQKFPDVVKGAWYYQAVTYLAGIGIIAGYPEGMFEPDASITRAEFVTMISRFAELRPGNGVTFSDIAGHWAEGEILSVAGRRWIVGYPDDTFRPENSLTRAEAVTIINRMLNRRVDRADLPGWAPVFSDITADYWAYADIMEASIGHNYERKPDGAELWTTKLPEQ